MSAVSVYIISDKIGKQFPRKCLRLPILSELCRRADMSCYRYFDKTYIMALEFTGKTIVVTGAGQGIGRALVSALVASGASVVAVDINPEELHALLKEYPGKVSTVVADLSDWDQTRNALNPVLTGPVDGLVNNAGVCIKEPFLSVSQGALYKQLAVNVMAVINVAQIVAANMLKHGRQGSIVNLSSQASKAALRDHTAYGASKGAVDQATRNMALELGPMGIRVNAVNPTVVKTEMGVRIWDANPEEARKMREKIPLGRFAEVGEVVDVVLFLLSGKSSMVTGSNVPIDGGFLAT